jgi:hypothetical protein
MKVLSALSGKNILKEGKRYERFLIKENGLESGTQSFLR